MCNNWASHHFWWNWLTFELCGFDLIKANESYRGRRDVLGTSCNLGEWELLSLEVGLVLRIYNDLIQVRIVLRENFLVFSNGLTIDIFSYLYVCSFLHCISNPCYVLEHLRQNEM